MPTIPVSLAFRPAGILLLLLALSGLPAGCQQLPAGSSTPNAETDPAASTKATGPVHADLRTGASGQIYAAADRIHEVHILAITDNAQSTIEHERTADDQKYWSARIGIKNAGSSEIRAGTWSLTGSDGTSYPWTVTLGLGSSFQDLTPIQPGATIEGPIAFKVPKDVTPKQLQYRVDHLKEIDTDFDAP
jgi:hypothetical protein